MKEPTIISLNSERAEQPDQKAISQVVDAISSYHHLGEVRAVASFATLSGGGVYAAAYPGLTAADRLALVGAIEKLKVDLLAGLPFTERLPEE